MKQFALACLFIVAGLSARSQYTWVNKNPFPDSGRYSECCFALNGMGYIVGGFVSATSLTYTYQVWQYNPSADSWTRKSDFPYSFLGGQVSVINDSAYKIGSVDENGYYYSTVYKYDATGNSWNSRSPFPEDGIGGNFQFVLNGKIYVGAGARNSNVHGVNSAYSYNPPTDTWTTIAAYPGPPSITVSGFAIDSFGYAGLGGDGDGNFYNNFYRYNPYSNSWSEIAPYPGKARYAIPIQFVLNGKAYVGGGATTLEGTTTFYELGDLYEYDPNRDTWTAVPSIPGPPRYAPAVFAIDNNAYIMGGVNSDGNVLYNDMSEFTLCGNVIDTVNITIADTNRVTIRDTLVVQLYDTSHIFITEADTLIIKAHLTGVSSLENSISVKVFPNPARNRLQVYFDDADYEAMKGYAIKITNILSQNVFVSPVNKQQFDIDIGNWGGAGIYALYIVDPQLKVVATKMIVIQ